MHFPLLLLLSVCFSTFSAFANDQDLSDDANVSENVPHPLPDRECQNGPSTRWCWSCGFNVADDFDKQWPDTGVTRYYDWNIENKTLSPDGFERPMLTVNGQYPGPALRADWGDMVVVKITNRLTDNGTAIHWHGMRMYRTNPMDGVPGVTQCPIAPGESMTYTFQATQYGTSWYHSHSDVQYCDGLLGPIIIDGPATANYDHDLGAMPITDWFHSTVSRLAYIAHRSLGPPPMADNGLINGSMVSPNGTVGGQYSRTWVQKGKKYRLRLINTANNDQFMVSLDGHRFQVIANDFVPVQPWWTDWLFLGIGQRYDVIIHANQSIGNYWFRAEAQDKVNCGLNKNNGNIKAIFSYHGADESSNPTSTRLGYTQSCADPPASSMVPFWNSFVPNQPLIEGRLNTAVKVGVDRVNNFVIEWGINMSAMSVDWTKPTLQYVLEGNSSFSKPQNVIVVDEAKWYYWIIQEVESRPVTIHIPHPMHLHGHDFYILGSGPGIFSQADRAALNFNNPPRRDTAMLPGGGWLVVAFQTDNAGAWLMHCHIAWHSEMGFALQFVENTNLTRGIIGSTQYRDQFDNTCAKWMQYYPNNSYYHRDFDISGV